VELSASFRCFNLRKEHRIEREEFGLNRGVAALALLLAAMVAASPAHARKRSRPAPYRLPPAALAQPAAPAAPLFAEVSPQPPAGLSSRRSILAPDLPLVGSVDVGVGLYSVTGARTREREFRRTDPMRDVRGSPDSRVAALGLSLRF
jgi:hypothetical protein